MRWLKSNNWLRDILFLFLLIGLVHLVIERNWDVYKQQLKNVFAVHAVDPWFVQQTKIVQTQIKTVTTLIDTSINQTATFMPYKERLLTLHQDVAALERAYANNCPALAALGPIGTAGIVLKEKDLEKKFLSIINETETIFNALVAQQKHLDYAFKPSESIQAGITNNTETIARLQA